MFGFGFLGFGFFPQECEDGTDHGNNFVCPLCTLDFSSPEKLISHVYQVRPTFSQSRSFESKPLLDFSPASVLFSG